MGKIDKIEQARRDGMLYAYKIAQERGLDGLEKELRFRNCTKLDLSISDSDYKDIIDNLSKTILDRILLLSVATLRDTFDFGEKRLNRFIENFNLKSECIEDKMVCWDDYTEVLQDEVNITLEAGK